MFGRPTTLFPAERTLPGRAEAPYGIPAKHRVLGTPLLADPADGTAPAGDEVAYFGLGCFCGAEEIYWKKPGVYTVIATSMTNPSQRSSAKITVKEDAPR